MISSNYDRKNGCISLARIVLVKVLDMLIFVGNRHTLEILVISYCLEVSADQKKIDLVSMALLELLDMIVDGV
jgi:hypothetical protein